MAEMLDEILPFITGHIDAHTANASQQPFFVALNGVQGAGKTTLVTAIARRLRSPPYSQSTVVLSIDDFYLSHKDQTQLARQFPDNPLLQHRGQPSTHDVKLWRQTLESLKHYKPTQIPQYDKSCFNGQGDRVEPKLWQVVNPDSISPVHVVILEGWCVGFRALSEQSLKAKWEEGYRERQQEASSYRGRLGWNRLEDIVQINNALREYEKLNSYFDIFVHIDAEDTYYVYDWRLEQEAALHMSKGSGMTDAEVRKFVDGYYPSYELYTDTLRAGALPTNKDSHSLPRQLRVVIDKHRKVLQTVHI